MKDATCKQGHRFEALVKMSDKEIPCRVEGCPEMAKIDEVAELRRFDKQGTHANLSSLRYHFNWISD
jgi:hypothetical protein